MTGSTAASEIPHELADLLRVARVRVYQESGAITRIRLGGMSPVWVFIGTFVACVIVFGMALPILVSVTGTKTFPTSIMLIGIALSFFVAAIFAMRKRARINAGLHDLIIDHQTSTMTLPVWKKRKDPVTISLNEITDVTLAEEIPRSETSGLDDLTFDAKRFSKRSVPSEKELDRQSHRFEMRYGAVVCWRERVRGEGASSETDTEHIEPVAVWADLRRASAFVEWLNAYLEPFGSSHSQTTE